MISNTFPPLPGPILKFKAGYFIKWCCIMGAVFVSSGVIIVRLQKSLFRSKE